MATIYQRIANPYMPQGTPAQTNAPTPFYAPGEIGLAFNDQSTGRGYVRVKLDSGATSATPVGAVAAGQLAFWKDRVAGIVTNDKRVADCPGATPAINRVAGIFQLAVTTAPGINGSDGNPLQYVCDLVIQGVNVSVASDGNGAAGDFAIADATASVSRVGRTAAGTAPVSQTIGVIRGAAANSLINVDVSLGFIA